MTTQQEQITPGQTYNAGKIRWRVVSIDGDTAYCVRVRKADGQRWVWDKDNGRNFAFAIIREHWELIG